VVAAVAVAPAAVVADAIAAAIVAEPPNTIE
jgi:hypothetical protein